MPGFDGTGPLGQGPFTGGGRGFCVVPAGYAGVQGYPVNYGYPYSANYGGYNAPSYNSYYFRRGDCMAPMPAGFGYFGRRSGAFFRGIGRGRGTRGMGRRSW